MKKILLLLVVTMTVLFTSCTENYSNGERIGMITKFTKGGLVCKSWEGHLNVTQTGMNSSNGFDFSIDRDNEPMSIVSTIDSAAQYGWKVKLVYHEVKGLNWFKNRGETDFFVTKCEVLDKTPMKGVFGNAEVSTGGRVVDTIYVVIDKSQLKK